MLTLAHYTRITFGEPLPRTVGGNKVMPAEVTSQIKVAKDEDGSIAWMWPEGYDMEEWVGEIGQVAPGPGVDVAGRPCGGSCSRPSPR